MLLLLTLVLLYVIANATDLNSNSLTKPKSAIGNNDIQNSKSNNNHNLNGKLEKLEVVSSHGRIDNSQKKIEVSTFAVILRTLYLCILFQPVLWTLPLAYLIPIFRNRIWFNLLTKSIALSGAAFIKWGQWAATRPDMFPERLCVALSDLHSNAREHSYRVTKQVSS